MLSIARRKHDRVGRSGFAGQSVLHHNRACNHADPTTRLKVHEAELSSTVTR